jgi:hypothetical protein
MDNNFEIKLIECLDLLESGEPIEQILARYPDDAVVLRPLLETAVALPALRFEPSPTAQARSRRAFLNRAAELRPAPLRFLGLPLRLGALAAAFVLALTLLGGGAVTASGAALPGDPLYGVKRAVERAQIVLAPNDDTLLREFEQRRREEVGALLAADRLAEVEFSGVIESISGEVWKIAGFTVRVSSTTQIDGPAAIGARARVHGRTDRREVQAVTVSIDAASVPPTATPTAIPAPSLTPQPSSTSAPTVTRAPSPTATIEPTVAPTATQPPPTQPPPTPRPAAPVPPPPRLAPSPRPQPPTPTTTGGSENRNDNSGNENRNDNSGNENRNDNSGNENRNENGGGGNDNSGNENRNENGGGGNDNSGSNDNTSNDNSGGGGSNDNTSNDNHNDNRNENGGGVGATTTATRTAVGRTSARRHTSTWKLRQGGSQGGLALPEKTSATPSVYCKLC